ncbi:ArsA family ATPase [Leptolyngbya sp. PCC 6406]|uniref:ArsA family ATPase n=1 Tax=Leptolyngbya sp. PCC 6406 TaxID=1173264 RepID=UPI0002D94B88|nr:ArsA family ATPase [Leptolyngbya sp. PCC 6406]
MAVFDLTQLTLISGKGGVGKTTSACAIALTRAAEYPQETVLLLSTDPAHSLGDVLGVAVDDEARSHPSLANLKLRALDADRLLAMFKADYGAVLETLVERGSFVEGDDLSPVWDMDWPGLNELMSLLEIQRILRAKEADRVVVDMAPSGHTLNLFGLMDFLDTFLQALTLFQDKHRYMVQALSGRYSKDEEDRFLTQMTADLASGRSQLQDPVRTACWVVALAESLSLRETERFVAALANLAIPLGGILINRLTGSPTQLDHLTAFDRIAPQTPVLGLPLRQQEPIGVEALRELWGAIAPAATWHSLAPIAVTLPHLHPIPPGCSDFITEGRRLVIVGGKGGVGKTTVAAAIATAMAHRHPEATVRVISIDPAHSLGDAFEQNLGHTPLALTANLSAQEVDAIAMLEQFRQDYLWELASMMGGDEDLGGLQVAYGPEGWRQIVSQALPGIDEMLALITVMELLEQDKETLIVLDTAPTGHLLGFLAMPTALGDWLGWIFKLWIKYQDVVGRVELMGRLRGLRKQVLQAQQRLTDGQYTEFIGVVQPQSAILAEATRLSTTLQTMGVVQRYIVHNRYSTGYELPPDSFPHQTIVRLPTLPETPHPRQQVEEAAHLLFEEP